MFIDKNYISDRILYGNLYLSHEAWQYISKVINEAPHKTERTGEWIRAQEKKLYCDWNMDGWFDYPLTCSYCGYDATEYGTGATSYCPSCGAEMDLKGDGPDV